MIDIHSHILPAMDDGPGSWAESLALCRLLAAQGVRIVVATPHYWPGVYEPRAGLIEQRVLELNLLLRKKRMDLTVLSGQEVVFCPEIRELLAKRAVLTLNGSRYVLLELPQLMAEEQLFTGIFQLQLAGYVPIIAHPEKNGMIQRDPGLMNELVCKGALGQVTASSLLESAPGKIRTCGQNLVCLRTVQIMSSDAHSVRGRPPRLAQGLEQAAELLKSRREAENMVLEGPKRIIQDRRLRLTEARGNEQEKGGFLRRLCKEAFG
ncbi:MAG: tyrosine-protein phosphatase [Thermodesulfobacteriota bacterium]